MAGNGINRTSKQNVAGSSPVSRSTENAHGFQRNWLTQQSVYFTEEYSKNLGPRKPTLAVSGADGIFILSNLVVCWQWGWALIL